MARTQTQEDRFWEIQQAIEKDKSELDRSKGALDKILKDAKRDLGTCNELELQALLSKKERSLARIDNKLNLDLKKLEDTYNEFNARKHQDMEN